MWSLAPFPYRLLYHMGTILEFGFSIGLYFVCHLLGFKSVFKEIQNVLSELKELTQKKTLLTLPRENVHKNLL